MWQIWFQYGIRKGNSSIWIAIQTALQQILSVSGLQTAEVIQKEILVLLCGCHCKGEDVHGTAVPNDAYTASEKHK
jgi:hypothetical protein